jgi:transcription termination/antitermination protein NusG
VVDEVNNAMSPMTPDEPQAHVPPLPENPDPSPTEADQAPAEAANHGATPMEAVDSERQSGSVDITGEDEQDWVPDQGSDRDDAQPVELAAPEEDRPINKQWYILKVQTNREDSIRDALQRRVAMAGLDKYFGEIIVPIEMVSEFKGGKKRVSKRKLYPGYIVVNMEINDDTWYLVRETSGIGDFTGALGRPTPMAPQDVAKIIQKTEEKTDESPRVDIRFKPHDRVRIKDGTFENFEGDVEAIDQANGRVTVLINIFGRSTPVDLEYWQIEAV